MSFRKSARTVSHGDSGGGPALRYGWTDQWGQVREAGPFRKESPGYREARALYEKRFPDSVPLFEFEDFLLFRLVPREARFVAGFAMAYTVSAAELKEVSALRPGP